MFRVYLIRTKKEASLELLTIRSLWPTRRVIEETIDMSLRGWSGSYNKDDNNNDRKLQRREKNTVIIKLY